MTNAGDDIVSLPIRNVYYLVRGINKKNTKVCLIHGGFFETIWKADLIYQSFLQVLEERFEKTNIKISEEIKQTITSFFTEQEIFSRTRNVEKSSVKLRFRVITEVKAEGNILNSKNYPEIVDNPLNYIIPCHTNFDESNHIEKN